MALATLSIDIEAKLASLEAGMDKAARLAEKNAAATEAAWKRAGSTLAGIGGTIAGAFAGFSLVEFVKSNVDAIDKLNDVADATGASIENISALEDLAKRTGTSIDVVSSSLIRLNKELSDTSVDSDAARALRAIGLSAADLRAQDPGEALRQVAVALGGYANDANKARLVQELFGKSIAEVAPFLNDLAEKTELVGTTTAAQAAEAEKFNKQLFDMQANAEATKRAFVSDLLPALNSLLNELRTGVQVFGGFNEALLSLGTSNLNKPISERREQIERLTDSLVRLQEEAKNPGLFFNAENNAKAQRQLQGLISEQEKLIEYTKRLQALNAPQASYSNEGRVKPEDKPSVGTIPDKAKPRQAEQIAEAQRALAAYVAELQKELDKTEELSEQQKALNFLRGLGAAGEIPQVRELVLGLQQKNTLAKQDAAIRADNSRITKEQEAAQKSLNDEIDRMSGRLEEARKIALTLRLEERLNSGEQFSAEELENAVLGIAGLRKEAAQTFGELDELTKEFGRNVQDALGDTILSTLKGDFDNILSLWGNLLLKMASQALAADLGKTLFGNLFGSKGEGAGQLGGAFGDLIQFIGNKMPFTLARGGVVEGPTITQFAAGGVFDRATRFSYGGGASIGELGEAGPEAIMPLRRGRDGKLGVAAAGAAGPTIVFQIASGVTRPELQAMVPALTEQIKAEVRASMRRPGGGY